MAQVYIVGGDGDDGRGGVRIHDFATGTLLRDLPRTSGITDNIERIVYHNNYIYINDGDGSVVCYDADNTFITRLDLGYYYDAGQIWKSSRGLHVIIRDDPDFNNNYPKKVLLTLNFVTLTEISRVVLDSDPLLWDGVANYITEQTYQDKTDDTGFWIRKYNTGMFRLDYSGAILDNISSSSSIDTDFSRNDFYINSTGNIMASCYSSAFRILDMAAKTFTETSFNLGTVFGATWIAHPSYADINGTLNAENVSGVKKVGTKYYFGCRIMNGDDPDFPARNGLVNYVAMLSVDLDLVSNPVIEFIHPIYSADGNLNPTGFSSMDDYGGKFYILDDTSFIYATRYFSSKYDTTGELWQTTSRFGVQQGYSRDGEDVNHYPTVIDIPTYTISGTITDTAGTTNRHILAYDDEKPDHLISETVTSSPYTLTFFSNRPKRLICKSVDNTKNDQVLSHLVPA